MDLDTKLLRKHVDVVKNALAEARGKGSHPHAGRKGKRGGSAPGPGKDYHVHWQTDQRTAAPTPDTVRASSRAEARKSFSAKWPTTKILKVRVAKKRKSYTSKGRLRGNPGSEYERPYGKGKK